MAWIFFTYYISNYMVIHTGVPMTKLDVTPEAREQRIADLNAQLDSQMEAIEVSRQIYNEIKEKYDHASDELAGRIQYMEAIRQDLISWQGE
jgi:hypothetical protein